MRALVQVAPAKTPEHMFVAVSEATRGCGAVEVMALATQSRVEINAFQTGGAVDSQARGAGPDGRLPAVEGPRGRLGEHRGGQPRPSIRQDDPHPISGMTHAHRLVAPLLLALPLAASATAQVQLPNAAEAGRSARLGPAYMTWMVHVEPSPWTIPAKFDHGCLILDQMATLVEDHGGRMCVALSRPFLDACASIANGPSKPGSVGDLAARGHEIAYHQHAGDEVSDTALIQSLVAPWTAESWPQHKEGPGAHLEYFNLGYRSGAGCGKDQASQLFHNAFHPFRPVEDDCYGQDPAGLLVHLPGGAVDGAGQASNNTAELEAGLLYALDQRRPDKLCFVNLTVTHPDDWFSAPPSEVLADFQLLDAWMTTAIDPLLAAGLVEWRTATEKRLLFEAWEQAGGDNSDLFPAPNVTDPDWSFLDDTNAPFTSDRIDEVLVDSQDRLWVGAGDESGGLSVLDQGLWSSFTTANSPLSANRITCLAEAPDGALWIGTFSTGPGTQTALHRFDGASWSVFNGTNSPVPDPFLFDVAVDPAGIVWVGGKSGLHRYNESSWTTYTSANSGLPANQRAIWSIEPAGPSALWLGLRTGGAVHFAHQGTPIQADDVWTIHNRASTTELLPSDTVHTVALDSAGRLFAGTMRGLAILDGGTWSAYTRADSDLGYDQVCDVAFDPSGRAWLALFGGGLSRYDPSTAVFENFDVPDGTLHARYNNSVNLDASGQLFAASLRAGGVSVYSGP